ncbi:MAG TPA: ketopantoate reductase family protein [Anaerolineae bacterium]|nr:ketopantoate reductase family protein [Anaerolineae bacterium]
MMQPIHNVVIFGAGAMGGYFTAQFLNVPEFSTAVLARGERYERLKRDGLIVNGRHYAVPVIHPDEDADPADLIIVALKNHHLPEAVPDLKSVVGAQATIISVMNGLDSEEIIGAVYGMDKLLYAVSVGIDAQRDGNRISYTRPGKHYVGLAENTHLDERVRRVQVAFERAGIAYETPVDMLRILWWKFMVNVGMNQASAVMRAPYGVFQTSPEAQALMEGLMHEVIVLAERAGINLKEKDIADWYTFLNTLSPQGKTSMLQDIEARRKTEVEAFGGKVVVLGERYGIPTPLNQTMIRIIHILEQYPPRG